MLLHLKLQIPIIKKKNPVLTNKTLFFSEKKNTQHVVTIFYLQGYFYNINFLVKVKHDPFLDPK
jgi:hypothetical protein